MPVASGIVRTRLFEGGTARRRGSKSRGGVASVVAGLL
jgi:hypothetical protein